MSYHIPGSMCVGVTVWFGWGVVVSLCRLKHYWSVRVGCAGWGVNGCLELWVCISWALLRNEFAYQDDARSNKLKI